MSARIHALLLLASVLLFAPGHAEAWEVDAPLHSNCHERLTAGALDSVGYRGGSAAAPTAEESVFIRNQQFDASHYPWNMDAIALILGVRSNDLGGLSDADLEGLAALQNDDQDQPAHCLRRRTDDGPAGDEAAVQRCRQFIEQEIALALAGLDAQGTAAPTEDVPAFIPFVGTVKRPLSRFYFHAGRALHTLQDSFTHTYRDPTWHHVQAVLNWLDAVHGDLDEARDGHQHESFLDQCDSPRSWRAAQLAATAEASERLYRLLVNADPGTPDTTRAKVTALLDDWLSYEPGCDLANAYCGNEVHADIVHNGLSRLSWGCAATGHGGTPWALLPILLVLAATRRRAPALLTAALAATPARAAPPSRPAAPAAVTVAQHPDSGQGGEPTVTVRGLLRAAGSVSEPAWAVAGGAMLTWRRLELEGAVEWNPWISEERREMFDGTLNIYALVAWRWPISPVVELRTGLGGGVSILLFETVGAPSGNVGPYLTLRPLGLTRRLGRRLALTIDAFEVSIPMPQMRGIPLFHTQYRFAVGLRF